MSVAELVSNRMDLMRPSLVVVVVVVVVAVVIIVIVVVVSHTQASGVVPQHGNGCRLSPI